MKTLVTGGAGFIGSHVVDELVQMGHEVVVLDDLSGGFMENLQQVQNKIRFIEGSITAGGADLLFETFKFDYVFHLAAYAAEGLSHFIRRFNYTNNLLGSMNLINAAIRHNVKCFVFTSSIAVYGNAKPVQEDTMPAPEDPYGIAKYAVELDLAAAHRQFGLDYIIFRPHNVYGERQNIGDPYRNVVGIFMNQILQGKPCTIFGDGHQRRAFTHISDVAPVIAKSVTVPQAYNQIFDIGADIPYSINELLLRIQSAMGIAATGVRWLPGRNEVFDYGGVRHSKVEGVFNYKVQYHLSLGLRKMAEWVKQNGTRAGKKFAGIELENGLPESWRNL